MVNHCLAVGYVDLLNNEGVEQVGEMAVVPFRILSGVGWFSGEEEVC